MDRCALFVDAGYVLGDGALAVHGTRNRESVSWDFAGVLGVLRNVARDHTGLPLLRCYWYEATVEGRRSSEHEQSHSHQSCPLAGPGRDAFASTRP